MVRLRRLVVDWIARPAVIGTDLLLMASEVRVGDEGSEDLEHVKQAEHAPDGRWRWRWRILARRLRRRAEQRVRAR
jgi:hypothetical protein